MRRMMQQGADIGDNVELIFTERKDGVLPETDVRTQSWDIAIEATDVAAKDHLAKREARHNPPKTDENPGGGDHKSDGKQE